MILRTDRHAAELPPPSDPDPKGAACVQELLGGEAAGMNERPSGVVANERD